MAEKLREKWLENWKKFHIQSKENFKGKIKGQLKNWRKKRNGGKIEKKNGWKIKTIYIYSKEKLVEKIKEIA